MNRKELAAIGVIATGVATVLTALLTSLLGFGEHAPGIVVAVLIGMLVLIFDVGRQQELTRERAACQECRKEHAAAMRELLQSVMADKQDTNDVIRAVEINLAELARGTRVSTMLAELSQRLRNQEAANIADNQSASIADAASRERDAEIGGRVAALKARMNGKDNANHVRK